MLKFFRKYNKIILVVGCVVLMIAFLIQPVISIFMPDPRNQPIGQVGERTLTVRDRQAADAQLQLYERGLRPIAMLVGTMLEPDDQNLHWLLMKEEARSMGLGASETEVANALAMMGMDEAQVEDLAQRFGAKPAFVRASVADWLMLEQYRDLMRARAYTPRIVAESGQSAVTVSSPGLQRLRALQQVFGYMNASQQAENFMQARLFMMLAQQLELRTMLGSQRLSQPVLRAAFQDQRAQLSGRLLLIPAEPFVDEAPEPGEAAIAEHFEQYKDMPAGQSEPYGFGYRIPDRVKLVYLTVPYDAVAETVTVSNTEALAEYEANKGRYMAPPGPDAGPDAEPEQLDYLAVRKQIMTQLKREKTQEKVRQIIRAAQGRFTDAQRVLPDDEDDRRYKAVPEGFEPPDFAQVATELSEEFGVTVGVQRRTENWVSADALDALPGLGAARVEAASQRTPLRAYVLSARAFDPANDNPAVTFRLQQDVVSQPMIGSDGSMYLFRLTDAQPAHAPESLDLVREQVVSDLKLLAALQDLASDAVVWEAQARTMGLDSVAEELELEVGNFGPVPKRRAGAGRETMVPEIAGIGRDRELIDEAFALASRLSARGELSEIDPGERIVAAAVEDSFKLAIMELGEYEPVTRSQFERAATEPDTRFEIALSLLPADTGDPMSLTRVKQRVGYTAEAGEETSDQTAEETAEEAGENPTP
ncbi:MAG: hypothetical protein GVY24_05115 [Planctomycetes bacterium]|nr:hypothetical protein [Planctomycetota bacterium]